MIGFFDSGIGGETILQAVEKRLPHLHTAYYADRAHMPYGNRPTEEIIELTQNGVLNLFDQGCALVVLACNTATAVAARRLQQHWLPALGRPGHNVIGIIIPTVELATHTGWAADHQKHEGDIGIFATLRTVESGVFPFEIQKIRPDVKVRQQPCPQLAAAIENNAAPAVLKPMVQGYVDQLLAQGPTPTRFILGCTHYAHIEDIFRDCLPANAEIIAQPAAVAEALAHYLPRHPEYQ